jgi:hypothetical protein
MEAGIRSTNFPQIGATMSNGARPAKATDVKYILAGTLLATTWKPSGVRTEPGGMFGLIVTSTWTSLLR